MEAVGRSRGRLRHDLRRRPGAAQGTIAPAGGCPGNFFTSRKWAFEHEMLVIRDHKGETLAQLSFAEGRFAGQGKDGASLTLSR